jgi:hypothetical protein
MKVFEAGAFGGKEAEGWGEVLFTHRGVEIGQRLLMALGLGRAPLHKEADH